jgi:hypothetical protein
MIARASQDVIPLCRIDLSSPSSLGDSFVIATSPLASSCQIDAGLVKSYFDPPRTAEFLTALRKAIDINLRGVPAACADELFYSICGVWPDSFDWQCPPLDAKSRTSPSLMMASP